MKKISCIILAAGSSSRLKNDVPKQYINLSGKPIIIHSLERLDKIDLIDELIIVAQSDRFDYLSKLIADFGIKKKIIYVGGGETRQDSVYRGLLKAQHDLVIIHEAARPFARIIDFMNLINETSPNVSLTVEIPFTVVKGNNQICDIFDRNQLRNIQLPQKFDKLTLIDAHKKAFDKNLSFTDDSTLLFQIAGLKTRLIQGNVNNIKITYNIDLLLAEEIYRDYILGAD